MPSLVSTAIGPVRSRIKKMLQGRRLMSSLTWLARRTVLTALALVFATATLGACSTTEQEREILSRARGRPRGSVPTGAGSRDLAASSAGYLIFPSVTAGGFIFGGQYGNGVLFKGGQPAGFYNITGGRSASRPAHRTFRRPTSSPRHKRSRRSSRRGLRTWRRSISPSRTWARQVISTSTLQSQSLFSSTASRGCSAAYRGRPEDHGTPRPSGGSWRVCPGGEPWLCRTSIRPRLCSICPQ